MINSAEILLVEDDEDDAEAIMFLLRKHVSSVIRHIDNGRSAIDYLFSNESDDLKIIFLDLVLPFVHGVEILQKLKADKIKSKIPVIILSSLNAEQYVNSFGLTADGYFSKHHIIDTSGDELAKLLATVSATVHTASAEPYSV